MKNFFNHLLGFIKFLVGLFFFLGAMVTVIVAAMGLLSEPGTIFTEGVNVTFAVIFMMPTGFVSMLYLANMAFKSAPTSRPQWELFEKSKRMTRTDRNLLFGTNEEITTVCDIFRRQKLDGTHEYKTVELYN